MALSVGTRIGPYEITDAIGAGGMSACGHTARERDVSISSRWGWGPTASVRK